MRLDLHRYGYAASSFKGSLCTAAPHIWGHSSLSQQGETAAGGGLGGLPMSSFPAPTLTPNNSKVHISFCLQTHGSALVPWQNTGLQKPENVNIEKKKIRKGSLKFPSCVLPRTSVSQETTSYCLLFQESSPVSWVSGSPRQQSPGFHFKSAEL